MPARRLCQPAVEQLESRLAPAVYHVDTFQDTPAANLATGQDAAGHVSLRSALAAADAKPQSDVVVLGAGTYSAQLGVFKTQDNVEIIGKGSGQTVIAGRPLERLFDAAGGALELQGLTLEGGSPTVLLKGDVHLADSQFSDADIAAVAAAVLAPKHEVAVPQPSAKLPESQRPPAEPVHVSAGPEHLVGPAGGGGTAIAKDQPQKAGGNPHRTYWRAEPDSKAEPAAEPEDMEPSCVLPGAAPPLAGADAAKQGGVIQKESPALGSRVSAQQLLARHDGAYAVFDPSQNPCQALALFFMVGWWSTRGSLKSKAGLGVKGRRRAANHTSVGSPSLPWRRAKASMASSCSSVSMEPGRSRRTRAIAFLADRFCSMK
jgi:hypothetical protein